MTQQYIVGELSLLLGRLRPEQATSLGDAACDLRRQVESSPVHALWALAPDALNLADTVCWDALERGEIDGFRGAIGAADDLRDFMVAAGLLPS